MYHIAVSSILESDKKWLQWWSQESFPGENK
jgi:hypothetical protein